MVATRSGKTSCKGVFVARKLEELGKEIGLASKDSVVAAYREDGSVYLQVNMKEKGKALELLWLIMGAILKNGGGK